MGHYSPAVSRPKNLKIYTYATLLDDNRLFAVRDISQLPTACKVPKGAIFQNTALLVQLTNNLPLHIYLLSRIPQWYSAKLLRASMIEDYACHWYKRQVPFIPVPSDLSDSTLKAMMRRGEEVLGADKDLANAHRHVDAVIEKGGRQKLYELIAADDPRCREVDMNFIGSTPVPVKGVRETVGGELISDSLLFRLPVGDAELRKYLTYVIGRMVDDSPDLELGRDDIGELIVPKNLPAVVAEIDKMERTNPQKAFSDALDRLDGVVASAFGMPQNYVDYIREQMTTDGFLAKMRPMLEQRGLRVQRYADHSEGGRYE